MLNVLTGKVTPSGKLTETYPVKMEDTPCYGNFPAKTRNAEYREGIYVGYRYYSTVGKAVAYPFGYGLSYTSFSYNNLEITEKGVSFTLTNTGNFDGGEISQIYIKYESNAVFRPQFELKGFAKTFLKTGESTKVTVPFDDKTFRYYNVKTDSWETEKGEYEILVGASSEDIRLKGKLDVIGTNAPEPYDKNLLPSYFSGKVLKVSNEEFYRLLGYEPQAEETKELLGMNDPLSAAGNGKGAFARFAVKLIEKLLKRSEKKGKPDLNLLFIYNMPFRAIGKMSAGMVDAGVLSGIMMIVNGHFFKGLGKVVSGFSRNKRANKEYEDTYNSDSVL